jgi:hypothetical protein
MRSLSRSFAGGELTPEMYGRLDLTAFQTGLATCKNFRTLPHGPAVNRAGFEFVSETKTSGSASRLIPFAFSATQTMVLEFGASYIRFHTDGGTLLAGTPTAWSNATAYVVGDLVSLAGTNYYCILAHTNHTPPNSTYWYPLPSTAYEIPTPYAAADLFRIHYVQSADVLTLVHPSYETRELRRLGATKWVLSTIAFEPTVDAPTNVSASATAGTGVAVNLDHEYVVTARVPDTLEESYASTSDTCSNDLSLPGAYNTITWTAVSGAIRYNVYKNFNGLFGYVGETNGTTFDDDNIVPDVSLTPPEPAAPFTGSGNYPSAVSYFEQRRVFAGTVNKPQNVWATRSGTESNLSSSIPVRDDDAISFRIAAREVNTVRHIVPLDDLILLTASAEWSVTSVNTDALTPTSLRARPKSYVGANDVQPVTVNSTILYAAARGGHVRELAYAQNQNGAIGYGNNDLSLLATHLFDLKTIVDMAFERTPYSTLWVVSSDGRLLGLTYVPEQKVSGWHQHTTDGVFESVAVVTEGANDALYVIVRRTINGSTKRYVERLHAREFTTLADAFFVDCGLTYQGAAATTISGLSHLEGKTVSILADGAVMPPAVVTSGQVTLQEAASTVHVGLPIEADLQTLPIVLERLEAFGQGRPKNINSVFLRLYRSSGIKAGPDEDHLREYKQRRSEPYNSPPDLIESDEIEIKVDNAWQHNGQILVRQSDPLPITVVSITLDAAIGG